FVGQILGSAEYFVRHGNSNQGWLESLYTRLLGRLPDAPGYDATLQAILNGYAAQRQAVAAAFVGSGDYRQKVVVDAYTQFLRRPPAQAEIDPWLRAFAQGATQEQLLATVFASDEYSQRVGGSNAAWLAQLYGDLLGRGLDAGAQGFLDCLQSGA